MKGFQLIEMLTERFRTHKGSSGKEVLFKMEGTDPRLLKPTGVMVVDRKGRHIVILEKTNESVLST